MQNRLENLCKAGIFSNNSSFWFLEKPKKVSASFRALMSHPECAKKNK